MNPPSPDQRAVAAFRQRYGYPPGGVWSAPGRVNLVGEHTDYNRGLCLPIALPQRAWLAASARRDDLVRLTSLDLDDTHSIKLGDVRPGHPANWSAYQCGVLWAMRQAGLPVGGVDAVLCSDVPVGAGLSSSAAVEGCLAVAADALFDLRLTSSDAGRAGLARLCQQAENEIVGAPTGGLDQTVSLRATPGNMLLIDFDAVTDGVPSVTPHPFDPGADGMTLLAVNTKAEHANTDGQYAARRCACEAAAAALGVTWLRQITLAGLPAALARLDDDAQVRAVRHIVTENARVRQAVAAASAHDWARFGALLNQAQASQRDDYRISCAQSDLTCEVALKAGALGARQTGGGFGGTVIVLANSHLTNTIIEVVTSAYVQNQWPAPDIFEVTAGAPAG